MKLFFGMSSLFTNILYLYQISQLRQGSAILSNFNYLKKTTNTDTKRLHKSVIKKIKRKQNTTGGGKRVMGRKTKMF